MMARHTSSGLAAACQFLLPCRGGRLGPAALAAVAGFALSAIGGAAADCPAILNVTSLYAQTVAEVVGGGELSLQNVRLSSSATPIRVSDGTEVQLSVRIDPHCADAVEGTAPTREALAAAIYLRRTNGSTLAILTDGSWGWRASTCVACPPDDVALTPTKLWAAYNASFTTGERVPPGAAWLTHNRGFDASKTVWRTVVKRMPAGICDDIDPVPMGSVAAAPPPNDGWPTASRVTSSVLGALLALVTGLVVRTGRDIRRERRHLYTPWGEEVWEQGALSAAEWERPAAVGPPDAVGGALWDPTAAAAAAPPVVAKPTRAAPASPSEPTDTTTSSGGESGGEVRATSSSLEVAMAAGFPVPPPMPAGLVNPVAGPARDVSGGAGAP
eukprot:TRINITY_DN3802_c0_g1_i1.p1 TRINITY_DN3802_c0_g1~~TRINITY_DN3802_c0_g1_i1.p1  ORF type:complete len:386 (-),score=93.35 TRINITY_DN3802_c0_g1_i1:235-1392(-)